MKTERLHELQAEIDAASAVKDLGLAAKLTMQYVSAAQELDEGEKQAKIDKKAVALQASTAPFPSGISP